MQSVTLLEKVVRVRIALKLVLCKNTRLYKPNFTSEVINLGASTEKKEIYLTFDDGPVPDFTPWVLETLKKFDAKATFFCVGENIEKYPHIFQQIIAAG